MEEDYLKVQLAQIDQRIKETEELLSDPEMGPLALAEIEDLKKQKSALENADSGGSFDEPRTTNNEPSTLDHRNVIIEVKGAAGGDEAKIWARELLRMYQRYCEIKKLPMEFLDETAFKIKARSAFGIFKFEAGVHRVQRIPETEKRGRVHTSTAIVSTLPELEDIDMHISPDDIEFEAYRSGGHGGQNVNKVSTAVRLKHIPSGIVVTAQTERQQHQNRENAMKLLRAKLWEQEIAKRNEMMSELKLTQVGKGSRAEKIRTYNFPQDRVTDHRIGQSYHNLPVIMEGDIEKILIDLREAEKADA